MQKVTLVAKTMITPPVCRNLFEMNSKCLVLMMILFAIFAFLIHILISHGLFWVTESQYNH